MTEVQWNGSDDPVRMLGHLCGRKVYNRKLQLFACAWCRRLWALFPDDRSRTGVETAERFVDGTATDRQLWLANARAKAVIVAEFCARSATADWDATAEWERRVALADAAWRAVDPGRIQDNLPRIVRTTAALVEGTPPLQAGQLIQVNLLRDIFGRPFPFRQVQLAPAWLSWNGGTAVQLAQAAYAGRLLPSGELDPGRLAALADALEEAGCNNADILSHLRGPGPHVRGCWVVDLLLDKP